MLPKARICTSEPESVRAETVLGRHVAPPPSGVGVLDESASATPATLREQLARHRADPDYATSHDELDPLGFALEGFDALGRVPDPRERTHLRANLTAFPAGRRTLAALVELVCAQPAFLGAGPR